MGAFRRTCHHRNAIHLLILFALSTSAWGRVFLHWTTSALPPARDLGINELTFSWSDVVSPVVKIAVKQGYRVYLESTLQQADAAVNKGSQIGVTGIILSVSQSERDQLEKTLPGLRQSQPELKFLVLNSEGKLPQMRGSLVIKRGSVLEVSSPTAQPWIDSNLSLVTIERSARPEQNPLYTFSRERSGAGQQQNPATADDYSLALSEAGAFHADLLLEIEEPLQRALAERDPKALALWSRVRSYVDFFFQEDKPSLTPAANVALVVDDLDPGDEVMNLLARHNIPFRPLRASEFMAQPLPQFDVVIAFAKPDSKIAERIAEVANRGKTVVIVDAHGSFPWQHGEATKLNEHAVSYAVGKGKVLELSEPVTDPETFAQDVRRLLGKQNALVSLWNGLTTIAVPYADDSGTVKLLELVNYAEDPVRVQVRVKGSFSSVQYETPEHKCCESLARTTQNGLTEFVIPDLRIAGRVHLEANPTSPSIPK